MAPASPTGDDLGVFANLWPLSGLTVHSRYDNSLT
jgi:hypothetical protein